jgi:hypothetical protein
MAEKSMQFESQKQRWLKYGLNVALSVIVVILLAGIICYITTRNTKRIDMTLTRSFALRPQTASILDHLKQKVTLVSLYPRKTPDGKDDDKYQAVVDLMEEYQRKSPSNIETDIIDPQTERGKLEQLIETVTSKYGTEIKKYKGLLDDYPKIVDAVKKFADDQNKKLAGVPLDKVENPKEGETLLYTVITIKKFPQDLADAKDRITRRLKQQIPDYKGATEDVRSNLDDLSAMLGQINDGFTEAKKDPKLPTDLKKYIDENLASYVATKKTVDDFVKRIDALGELKLDTLREQVRREKSVLVMGESDIKVLPFDAVWKPVSSKGLEPGETVAPMEFSGEQQIDTAMVALSTARKPTVVFVRPGGAPLASNGMMGQGQAGPLSEIADRLRDANFDVVEKDLSGQYAEQAAMQGMPPEPEATDEQLKTGVWVVVDFAPAEGRAGPNPMGPRLAAHLKEGGSALVLAYMQADPLDIALNEWGVKLNTDAIVVHELIKSTGVQAKDPFEEVQRFPYVFITTDYGNHPIANPLRSLEGLLVPMVPVKVTPQKGYAGTPLIPIPRTVKSWGERDVQKVLDGEATEFDANDIPNTDTDKMYAGAAVEKSGTGNRLVVLGSIQFTTNGIVSRPDYELSRQEQRRIDRFPGNTELMKNSLYWLSHMDSMLALSPSAMQVSRIAPMSPRAQAGWRILLVAGLPMVVVIIGAMVYLNRRD